MMRRNIGMDLVFNCPVINQAAKLVLIVFASHESGPDITKTVIPAAT